MKCEVPADFLGNSRFLNIFLMLIYPRNMKHTPNIIFALGAAYAQDVLVEPYGQCKNLLSTCALPYQILIMTF
jgi:hypothetical protein